MLVTPVKTYRIRHYEQPSLEEVIVDCLPIPTENTVLAIGAKIVALCEGSFEYEGAADVNVLLPADPQYTANRIRKFLREHYGLENVGVIIACDVAGVILAYSGFEATSRGKDILANLAYTSFLIMAENGESAPMVTIENAPFIKFTSNDPTLDELAQVTIAKQVYSFDQLSTSRKS
jgi:F420-0:gamma-glutamyl ligase